MESRREAVAADWLTCGEVLGLGGRCGVEGGAEAAACAGGEWHGRAGAAQGQDPGVRGEQRRAGGGREGAEARAEVEAEARGHGSSAVSLPLIFPLSFPWRLGVLEDVGAGPRAEHTMTP